MTSRTNTATASETNWLMFRFRAEFSDAPTERKFREHNLKVDALRIVIVCSGMALFQIAGVVVDLQRLDPEVIPRLLTMRFTGLILCIVLAAAAYFRPMVSKLNAIPLLLMTVLTTLYTIAAYEYSIHLGISDSTIIYGFLSFVSFLIVSAPMWVSLINAGVILFEALALHFFFLKSDVTDLSALLITYIVLSALGVFVAIVLRKLRRREFASQSLLQAEEVQRRILEEQLRVHQAELETTVAQRTEQLRKSEQSLIQAQKMESIGQLAGGMAHDINNVLMVVLGYENLSITENDLPTIRKYLKEIRVAAERGAEMIKRLLAFSRRQVMSLDSVEIGSLMTKLHSMIRVVIPSNIEMNLNLPEEPLSTLADSVQLEQALTNLIINARDAMPGGGTVNLSTSLETLVDSFVDENPWAKVGQYVVISVADTGLGISDEVKEQIFEPFFTSKPEGQGTGLGLAVVFGIVSQLGGFIHVSSEIGKGAEFKLYLPYLANPSPAPRVESEQSEFTGTETILLIEDDPQIRELESLVLRDAGYTVIEAADGLQGLATYEQQKSEIDLLLLDVVMPRMGGEELFGAIRDMGDDVPILFKTGYSGSAAHTDFILREGLAMLPKPYEPDLLKRRIREVLGREN